MGGAPGSGGPAGSGGQPGFGGQPVTGGNLGSGGLVGSGGYPGLGGKAGSGGIVGSGGITSGSGGAGKGGTSGSGGTMGAVTFNHGQAVGGSMSGYGWVSLGAKDSLSSPACGGTPITSTTPCASTIDWPFAGLCVTGFIPPLPRTPLQADYDANWGILFSANASVQTGATLGKSYQTVTFNLTGSPLSGLRAVVHRKWDQDTFNYCASMMSGSRISLSAFNSSCWDGTGMQLASTDVTDIDWVGVEIPSTPTAITVSNLCLMSIIFE